MSFIPYGNSPELTGLLSEIASHEHTLVAARIGEDGILAALDENNVSRETMMQLTEDEWKTYKAAEPELSELKRQPTASERERDVRLEVAAHITSLFGKIDGYILSSVVPASFWLSTGNALCEGETNIIVEPVQDGLEVSKVFLLYRDDQGNFLPSLPHKNLNIVSKDKEAIVNAIRRLGEVNTLLSEADRK